MTRRDFIMLSKALSDCRERIKSQGFNNELEQQAQRDKLAGVRKAAAHIADAIREDNPTFDAQRFLVDCGYGGTGPAYRPRDIDDAGQPVAPVPPRESAKQIAARIRKGEGPDPSLISNINQRRGDQ